MLDGNQCPVGVITRGDVVRASPPIKTADSTHPSFPLSRPMLRSLLMACVLVVVPLQGTPTSRPRPRKWISWTWWMARNVLIQAKGVDAVNAGQGQGLAFPALGYWSVEGHCFVKPAQATATACSSAKGVPPFAIPGQAARLSTRNGENNTRLPATKPAVTTAARTSKPPMFWLAWLEHAPLGCPWRGLVWLSTCATNGVS